MQSVNCPSCGAPVKFHSTASVSAVCEYCQSTLLKSGEAIKNLGKMADVLEDYSPIQIGTSGQFAGKEFTVIGRIQLRYSAGFWNEWYIIYNDGTTAWLSDASGQFTITEKCNARQGLPAFDALQPAQIVKLSGTSFTISDVRSAQCTGGQGELPYQIGTGSGWEAKVVDMRSGKQFLTLDYSDDATPTLYLGHAVQLEQLNCQLLRDVDTIASSAGKVKGKVNSISCPSCGSGVKYVPGKTSTLVCESCQSTLDTAGEVAEVIAAGNRMANITTTLEIGTKMNYAGGHYELIGLMRRAGGEDNAIWTEYLFYSFKAGFLWFAETKYGWFRSKVMDEWPELRNNEEAVYLTSRYQQSEQYSARTVFVAGAFNWQAKIGDTVLVREFQAGSQLMTMETSHEEVTWSMTSPVSADQLHALFGDKIAPDVKMFHGHQYGDPENQMTPGIISILAMCALNFIPLMVADGAFVFFVLLIAAALIWVPEKYMLDSHD